MVEIRPFQTEDWRSLLDLANQAVPFAPGENAEWLAYRKAFDQGARLRRHYMVMHEEEPVGYGCLEQQSDDPAWLRIFVVCSPSHLQGDVGASLYAQLLADARQLEAGHLWAREFQEDEPIRRFLLEQGFVEVKRFTLPEQRPMVIYTLKL